MQRRFDEVDGAFAYDEGEGYRSLAFWREAHERHFRRLNVFEPNMMLWCERFQVEMVGKNPGQIASLIRVAGETAMALWTLYRAGRALGPPLRAP